MRNFFSSSLLCAFLSLFLFSCEEEAPLPDVQVREPANGFEVDPGDTLEVKLKARAKAGIDALHFSILSGAHKQVTSPHRIDRNGETELEERFFYPIEGEPEGGMGSHELRVTVVDERGERRSAFVEGRVTSEPLRFERVFVVLRPQEQRVEVHTVEGPNAPPQLFKVLDRDFSGAALSNVHRELLIAGSHSGDLSAFDVHGGQELWTVENQGASPYPFFMGLTSSTDDRWVFAPMGTERLEGYRGGSGPGITVQAIEDAFIRSVALVDGQLLTEQEPVGTGMREWVTYYPSTGSIEERIQIPDRNVVEILPGRAGQALVLMNENGNAQLEHYDVQGRFFEDYQSLPSGEFHGGVSMGGGRDLLLHDQGLWVHDKGSQSLGQLSTIRPQAIAYDRVGERIFAGEGTSLRVLDGEGGNEIWSRTFQDSIRSIHVLYSD